MKQYQKDTLKYINDNKKGDNLKFIDIIYYCFNCNTFEKEEKELLLSIDKIYDNLICQFSLFSLKKLTRILQ